MPGRSCRLVALSDWGPGDTWLVEDSLLLPIVFRGRDLGYLQISPGVPGDDEEFIGELTRQGLESMRLRKALLTDRETGLFSRDYFSGRLLRALKKRRRPGAAMNLSLDEDISPELILVMAELRDAAEPHQALIDFAALLNRHLNLKCPARSGLRQLAFLAEGKPEEIRLNLEAALDEQLETKPSSRPIASWVRWPFDLERDPAGDEPGHLRRQARELWEMAETALFYARQSRGSAAGVAFGDLVDHYGQITQVLPMDRVIVNLGRTTGAAPGQVFLVSAPVERPSAEPQYKGEVTIFEVQDNYSLAYVNESKSPLKLVAGDRLNFSRRDFGAAEKAEPDRALPAFLANLLEREDFLNRLDGFVAGPLALALVRFDAYDKNISLMGREEGSKALAFAFEKTAADLPETCLKTLWWPDTMALAWPEAERGELMPMIEKLAASVRESAPLSFGLIFIDGEKGDRPEGILDDARKALHEAAFSGPGQVAVFGPLALNISGDRLFESGDIEGAVNEYERGLKIAPDDLNLLNSLGVCYGRLGSASQAIGVFEKVIKNDPENMMALYNLGYTHLQAGRLVEAEKVLARAAELAPDNFETLFHLGKTALDLGHLDNALDALKKAAELENARPMIHRLLGEVMMLAGDHQGALATFKKAVKATPNDAYVLSTLGVLFMDQANDLPVAGSLFKKSVEIDPTNSLYQQRLGWLLYKLNEHKEAEKHLKLALEYGGRSAELYYQLGCLAEEDGRLKEAKAHFKRALSEDSAYQPALDKIGR